MMHSLSSGFMVSRLSSWGSVDRLLIEGTRNESRSDVDRLDKKQRVTSSTSIGNRYLYKLIQNKLLNTQVYSEIRGLSVRSTRRFV